MERGRGTSGIFPVERDGEEAQPFDLRLKDVSLEPKEKGLFQYKADGKLAIKWTLWQLYLRDEASTIKTLTQTK